MSDDEQPYELMMPFVLCKSVGGPHDDDAFVSGWRMAELDWTLKSSRSEAEIHFTIREDERAQADLIAMRNGRTMDLVPFDPTADEFEVAARHGVDGWLCVAFQGTP